LITVIQPQLTAKLIAYQIKRKCEEQVRSKACLLFKQEEFMKVLNKHNESFHYWDMATKDRLTLHPGVNTVDEKVYKKLQHKFADNSHLSQVSEMNDIQIPKKSLPIEPIVIDVPGEGPVIIDLPVESKSSKKRKAVLKQMNEG
jgi:hypothetical protein